MKFRNLFALCCAGVVSFGLLGCSGGDGESEGPPSFTLAWSEYPSWSVFGVAHEQNLIDGDEGELGPIEEKWGVDIVLREVDYDTCITMYSGSSLTA